jgi:hypothetical protein
MRDNTRIMMKRILTGTRVLICAIVLLLFVSPAHAQQQQEGPNSDGTPQKAQGQAPDAPAAPSAGIVPGTSNDRLFWTLPNFLTLDASGHVIPLTAKQKFKVVARGSFDPIEFGWYAIIAGINQAEASEHGYGQGFQGYGKRYGSAIADGTIENFMAQAVYPSLLHQDPRFFPEGTGGFWHRTEYAVSRIFITRGDSGNPEFNFSEILGSATSAAISTYSYHPHADKTIGNTASVWGTQITYDTLTIVLKEFWPDIHRRFSHKPKAD